MIMEHPAHPTRHIGWTAQATSTTVLTVEGTCPIMGPSVHPSHIGRVI